MPELPEVETIISDLNRKIKGDTITDFWSDWPKAIKGKSLKEFTKEIKGRKILGARRIGKNIFIDLSGSPLHSGRGKKTLYIHLKMTGHLLVKSEILNSKSETNSKSKIKNLKHDYFSDRVNQYIHHIWYLKTDAKQRKKFESTKNKFAGSQKLAGSNRTLEFSDVRKFAKIVLDDTEKINNLPEIKKLGVDAMSKEFTLNKFKEILARRPHKKIGLDLMEQ